MVAYSLPEVRDALKDDALAAEFGRRFLNAYAATAIVEGFGCRPMHEGRGWR